MELLNENERWRIVQEDCIEHMATMPAASVDFSIFSPPFPSLFAYTDSEADLGNSESFTGDAKLHLMFFANQFARVLRPGRVAIVHCQQIPGLKRNGEYSTVDLRGILIRVGKRAGLIYESDWPVTKNPQAQAIRTHSHKLQFASVARDQAVIAPAFNDYLIKFRAPGENTTPVKEQLSRSEWIELAVDASRADQLRCAGNGCVALQAAVAFVELFRRLRHPRRGGQGDVRWHG